MSKPVDVSGFTKLHSDLEEATFVADYLGRAVEVRAKTLGALYGIEGEKEEGIQKASVKTMIQSAALELQALEGARSVLLSDIRMLKREIEENKMVRGE